MSAIILTPAAARRALDDREASDEELLHRYASAVWCHLIEPGDAVAGALVSALGPIEALRRALGPDLTGADVDGHVALREARRRWLPRADADAVSHSLATARRRGLRLLLPGESDWPAMLGDLGAHAPLCLWVRGDPAALVGARGDWHVAELKLALLP